jgi:hypothetical protein
VKGGRYFKEFVILIGMIGEKGERINDSRRKETGNESLNNSFKDVC